MQKITLIAAMANNRVIGENNDIPWHIPEDFAFFKQYTTGKPVIMGRKTWDSLPRKPLPQRRNMVVSRQDDAYFAGAEVFGDLQAALNACEGAAEIIIMGGAQIYAHALAANVATDLRLTEIDLTVQGDVRFPDVLAAQWCELAREKHVSKQGVHFDFVHYQNVHFYP